MTTTCVAVSGSSLLTSNFTNEAELIVRLRTGDGNAYETLFRTHAGAMLAVARRFFGDTDDAADAVQDAFVSAFRAMRSFEGASQLGTWLHRITVNACLMKLRRRRRCRLVLLEDLCQASETIRFATVKANSDDDSLARAETASRVRACLDRLSEAHRTVIQLRDMQGLDTEETAARLGTNEAVVKTRLHRARTALRSILELEFAGSN